VGSENQVDVLIFAPDSLTNVLLLHHAAAEPDQKRRVLLFQPGEGADAPKDLQLGVSRMAQVFRRIRSAAPASSVNSYPSGEASP
jgi:hypothetical protein